MATGLKATKKTSAGGPTTLTDVLKTLRDHLPELRARYGLREMGVFGSFVRGEANRRSDVDLLVEFDDRPLTLLQVVALENHLSDFLGIKVDLVEKSALKPAIEKCILREVVML